MSVARTPQALVLDVESCNQLVGCPGCGVIAHGHGRVVVEVIDAPSAGVPARIRCHKRRWICREHTCETVTFLEHSEKVCAPINTRGKPGVHTKPDAALSSGGNCTTRGSNTPATRHQKASCSAKAPPLPAWREPLRLRHSGTVPVDAKKLAQHGPSSGFSAKKLAQQAQKRRIWGVLSALGELFRAFAMTQRRRANFFVPNDTATAKTGPGQAPPQFRMQFDCMKFQ